LRSLLFDCDLLWLQEKTITVEDFHDQLHRSTNFPLRPFVIPFLKVIVTVNHRIITEPLQKSSYQGTSPEEIPFFPVNTPMVTPYTVSIESLLSAHVATKGKGLSGHRHFFVIL